jgi:hypothetical protein
MTPQFLAPPDLQRDLARWRMPFLAGGVLLLLACLVAGLFTPSAALHGYLIGFLFWWGLALGSLAFLMMQYLTGGAWGVVTRRIFEAAASTLPLLAVLFIPFLFGLGWLYDWAHPDLVRRTALLSHRAPYMTPTWFVVRAILYFAVWIGLAHYLNRWSREQDAGNPQRREALGKLSAIGLILYVFTVTFASVDWAESLRTEWYSTMWGFLFVASQALTALSFVIATAAMLKKREPMRSVLRPAHFHDLGKLLLMAVMIWAYFAFSQFLIVWAGDLTHEISWYLPRMKTSWGWIGVALILVEFVIPFLLLLSMPLKRNPRALMVVVAIILFARYLDFVWLILPNFGPHGFQIGWLDFAAPLGIGGLWLWFFLGELPKRPLVPVNSPFLEDALIHGEN